MTDKAKKYPSGLVGVIAVLVLIYGLIAAIQNVFSPPANVKLVQGLSIHYYPHEERVRSEVFMPHLLTGEYAPCQVFDDAHVNCGSNEPHTMDVYFNYFNAPKAGSWECRRNEQS